MTEPQKARPAEKGQRRVWCVYNTNARQGEPGRVDYVLFGAELSALRYMAEHHMDGCKAIEFGVPLQDQIQ